MIDSGRSDFGQSVPDDQFSNDRLLRFYSFQVYLLWFYKEGQKAGEVKISLLPSFWGFLYWKIFKNPSVSGADTVFSGKILRDVYKTENNYRIFCIHVYFYSIFGIWTGKICMCVL